MLVVVVVIDYSVGLLLRRRCGLEKKKVTGTSRKLYNEGLLKLSYSPGIIRVKIKEMR
jgi:hypothetical protein